MSQISEVIFSMISIVFLKQIIVLFVFITYLMQVIVFSMYFYLVLTLTTKDGIFTYDWASPTGNSSREDRRTGSYAFFDDNELVAVLETLKRSLRAFERLLSSPSSSKTPTCLWVVRRGSGARLAADLGAGVAFVAACREGERVERKREIN